MIVICQCYVSGSIYYEYQEEVADPALTLMVYLLSSFSFHHVVQQKFFQDFAGLSSDYGPVIKHKGRDARYSQLSGKVPIGIDRFPEGPRFQDFHGLLVGEPHRFCQPDQLIKLGDIDTVDIISPEDGIVEFIPFPFGLGPLAQFRGEPAVVSLRSLSQGQT